MEHPGPLRHRRLMHDYLFSIEMVRFAFVAGIVVSMVNYERRHLTTGSIVVPGYIAVFMLQPAVLAATFVNAFVSYWAVNRILPRWFLLYGKNKFAVLCLISISLQTAMLKLSPSGSYLWERDVPLLIGAGYVVPALIAHDMARQGIKKTIKSVMVAGIIVAVPIGYALWFDLPGVNELSPLTGFGVSAIQAAWIPFAVFLSALVAWALLKNHGLRSGGFIGAAYLGMLAVQPMQAIFALGVGYATYLIVTRGLMPWMILFGRRKFATMLLLAAIISWTTMWVGTAVFGFEVTYYMNLGSIALTPLFLPGLLANDMHRASPLRVVGGVALGGSFVIPLTLAFEMAMAGIFPHLWVMIATLSGSLIFRDQIAWLSNRVLGGIVVAVRGKGGQHSTSVEGLLAAVEPTADGPRRLERVDLSIARSETAQTSEERERVSAL